MTVTYGDRYVRLTAETIKRALAAGVSHVVVVDNGSTHGLDRVMLQQFAGDGRVSFLHLGENLGSAVGFARGIQAAAATHPNYIWLLDDDNWVDPEALTLLLSTRAAAAGHFRDPLVAVSGFRDLDSDHLRIGEGRPASVVFPPVGAFLSFDVIHYLRRRLPIRYPTLKWEDLCLPNAPYGGLLFPVELIEEVGLPPAEYFLYADDTVWTSRITASGHKILLDRSVTIHDADSKWSRESGGGPRGLIASRDTRRLYYSVRNRVHYERSLLKRPTQVLRYHINKLVYLVIASTSRFDGNRNNLRVFTDAIEDGRRLVVTSVGEVGE